MKTNLNMKAGFAKTHYSMTGTLLCLIILCTPIFVSAQKTDASYNYFKAIEYYDQGMLDSVTAILDGAKMQKDIFKASSRSLKANICKLNAQAKLLLNNPQDAREDIKEMRRYDPFYVPVKGEDLQQFRKIYNGLTVRPKHLISVSAISRIIPVELVRLYSKQEDASYTLANTTDAAYSIRYEYMLDPRFGLGLGLTSGNRHVPLVEERYRNGIITISPLIVHDFYDITFYGRYSLDINKFMSANIITGITGRRFGYESRQEYYDSDYGRYFLKKSYSINYYPLVAVFPKDNLNVNLVFGGGISLYWKRSSVQINIHLLPYLFSNHPLESINSFEDINSIQIPDQINDAGLYDKNGPWFAAARDILVYNEKPTIQLGISYGYALGFRAY